VTSGASPAPILLLGAGGLLGTELRATLSPLAPLVAPARDTLDLADLDAMRAAVRALRPAAIVNAAAWTAVDDAERERDMARHLNAAVPRALAEEAARLEVPLVHYGTDYVFDGRASRPYTELDSPNPLNVYGETKLDGENALRAVGGSFLILRTSWLYGTAGRSFLGTIRRLARESGELRIVDDQRGCPTWSRRVAEATARILAEAGDRGRFILAPKRVGTFHVAAAGEATWFDFARAILELDARAEHRHGGIVPIATSDRPTAARRPPYSVLSTESAQAAFGLRFEHWRDDLTRAMAVGSGGAEP